MAKLKTGATIRVVLFATLLCLGACSGTTFVYNQLDNILPWYIDDYVNLDGSQEQQTPTDITAVAQRLAFGFCSHFYAPGVRIPVLITPRGLPEAPSGAYPKGASRRRAAARPLLSGAGLQLISMIRQPLDQQIVK